MPLPIIENLEPEVVPSVEARNYDAMYNNLIVSRYLNGKQNCRLGFRPYDSTADVMKEDGDVTVEIEDMYTEAASRPVIGEVMAAITALAGLLCQEKQLINKIDAEEDEGVLATLNEQLDTLVTQIETTDLSTLLGG